MYIYNNYKVYKSNQISSIFYIIIQNQNVNILSHNHKNNNNRVQIVFQLDGYYFSLNIYIYINESKII
jgi:hypothetical protein